ncbi:MAG TPA: phospholipase D-like domain-containing protein [Polyangia bacterium]|nr:phospholipase D-like domain-containing protein [Polyangia bacterium]
MKTLVFLSLVAACNLGPPSPQPAPSPARPVQLLIEPDAGQRAVLDLISGAGRSVWGELYLLTDGAAIDALAARAAAGCDVRILLEPAPYQAETANQDAYARLAAAGADVRWSTPRFTYTHAKVLVVDHARLAVLTLNLTASGLSGNREYALLDANPADVTAMEAIFAADRVGSPTTAPAAPLVTSPETTRPTLLGLIASAQRTLAIETEELADSAVIAALSAARARGVAVTLAWPGPAAGAASTGSSTFFDLASTGAVVRAVSAPPIHGKVIAVDGWSVYVGSANLTATSLDANREVGLRLDDPSLAQAIASTVLADAASGVPP